MSKSGLRQASEEDLRTLGQTLWSWTFCDTCQAAPCTSLICASRRTKRLVSYFRYFNDIVIPYQWRARSTQHAVLESHKDILDMINFIKSKTDMPRELLTTEYAATISARPQFTTDELDSAFNVAISIMFMIQSGQQQRDIGRIERGTVQTPWRQNMTLVEFVEGRFPVTETPELNDPNDESTESMRDSLTACELMKRAGLKFRATDDLGRHLRLNRATGEVEIFHHTAFLKEHLRLTKDLKPDATVSECLALGALPRQLALETLDTLQKLLFPLGERDSSTLLRSLIASENLDPDIALIESTASFRRPDEATFYHHWGERLADLWAEMESPTARGSAEKWLERRSGARYVMLATLIGVVFAVILGMAGVGISGFQAWVGYQAWKHPVAVSGGSLGVAAATTVV